FLRRRPPHRTHFPSTTLFRSCVERARRCTHQFSINHRCLRSGKASARGAPHDRATMAPTPCDRTGLRAAALTIAAGVALACAPAAAQDLPRLRGAVAEEDVNNELLGGAALQSPFGDEEEARPRQSRQQRRAAASP